MTAAVLLLSAVERLKYLLGGETAPDGVEQLYSDLGLIADTLSDADGEVNRLNRLNRLNPQVRELNRQVRELAYDIEDSVECFARRSDVSVKWRHWRCFFSSYYKSFAEDVQVFSRRARAIVDLMGALDGDNHNSPTAEPQRIDPQRIGGSNTETLLPVGPDGYKENLMGLLLGEGSGLSVIGIYGVPGIGKSTLANWAYNEDVVKQHFQYRAWVYVSQDYEASHILRDLLLCFNEINPSKVASMETMELAQMLYRNLKGRKYLLILDDVWSAEAWGSLRFLFPDDKNGSRIVITTRSMEVAQQASKPEPPIEMKPLGAEESWQLFLTKSGMLDKPGSSKQQIEKFREKIVSACQGLPLVISVIGQSLSGTSLQNWELILQKPPFSSEDAIESRIYDILDLSYRNLPFRLKACFLYMGYFPPDQLILVDKLHLLWMAEGLISKTNEPEVKEYIEDLVYRNLVDVEEKEDMLASSWHLHYLIRNFCISRGEQEDIFEVNDFSHAKKTSSSTRRLAVYLHAFNHTNDVLLNVPDAKCIRSILFFDTVEREPESTWPSEFADLTDFLRIRVLDFDGVNFEVKGLPRGIEKLIYLRHLSFRGCYLQKLPSSFGNFSFLETLDLRVIDSCTMTIPNILGKLSRLRLLYFPLAFQCDGKEKLKLDCLKNLEVVENFDADSCDTEGLQHLENLQILTGTLDGINLDMNIINSIKKMNSIGQSSLVVKGFDCYSKRRLSILAELLACDGLHALDLEGHLEVSPRDITFGHNFTKMVFDGSEFSEDPMPVLGKLPNLKSLVLRNDAFVGLEVVCHESDFPQLTSLKLATLQYLEKLEVEDGAMPKLTILTIEHCDKLNTLPHELLHTLKEMMIGSMSETFHSKVKAIIEEQVSRGFVRTEATFYDC